MNDKELLHSLKKRVKDLERKVDQTEKLAKIVVTYSKEVNLQVDAVVKLLSEKKVLTKEEHQKAFDSIRGLRVRGGLEKIEVGDTVWVSFVTTLPDKSEIKEDNFPIRVGANAVAFEDALIGKLPNSNFTTHVAFPKDYFTKDVAGHTLVFKVEIGKVKTKIDQEKELRRLSDGTRK